MKNNILKFALAASLLLNVSVFATAAYRYYAQSRIWVSPFGKVMEKDRFLFEELSLKPEQLAAMKKEARTFRAEIDRRRQEIDTKRKELVALMRDQDPDNGDHHQQFHEREPSGATQRLHGTILPEER